MAIPDGRIKDRTRLLEMILLVQIAIGILEPGAG
jgi:hypothetical protein